MSDILIEVNKLNLKSHDNFILKDIDLTIRKNDFITLIGPNGAGKSMLLKSMMGLIPLTSGNITYKDNLKIGYIPQRFICDKTLPMSVKYFLRLGKNHEKSFYEEIVEQTKIEALLNKQLSHLSGGELQRVLLARALLQKPDLLILDEPAQNLDLTGQIHFYDYLKKLYEEKKLTIFMVSHDLHLVMSCTKYVICLYHHICCAGTPQSIAQEPQFLSLFGHDISKLMSLYHHEHNHTHNHE